MPNFFGKMITLAGLAATAAMADPVKMTFTGVQGTAAFGYYVGPYYGTLEGQNVSLYCDDFANEVNFGQKWEANLSKITAGSDLSNTRFGGVADALKEYQEIAWLDMQFALQPASEYGDLHATIWSFFDPAGAPKPSSDRWLKLAEAGYGTMSYDDFRVVTNVGPVLPTGQVQEFLTILNPEVNTALATPEPAPFLLMGLGLVTVGMIARGWRRRAAVRSGTGAPRYN